MAGMWIKRSSWSSIKNMWIRTTTGWSPVRSGYIRVNNTSTGWKRFWFKANLPNEITKPRFNTTNTGSGTIYDGPTATSPQYLNADLFGKDGTYSNYTAITGRKISYGDTATADINSRTTLVNDDRFTSAGGVTTSNRLSVDEKYLFYEMTVENGTDPLNQINSISNGIKMIKSQPFSNSFTVTGGVEVGATLTANIDIEYYYYNRPQLSLSYVKWYVGDYAGDTSGTPVRTTSLSTAQTAVTSSAYTGSDAFSVTSAHLDKYITLTLVVESSWTRNENYSTSSYQLDFAYAGDGNPVTTALSISNVQVKDYYDKNGLDNRGRWPTGTLNQYTGTVSGWDSSTVLRIRYRVFNYDTFRYYKPSTGAIQADTTAGASAAWDSWTSNGTGNGYISDVTVSGSTATFYDYFDLSSDFFNGGGSGPTWWLEIELSAIKAGGTRTYYINPYETFYISKRIDPTVSVSPSTVGLNTNVTISGTFAGFPATPSTNAYPRQYIVYYGDDNDSGYLPAGEWANGTLNPTYSLTKSYSTAGTYTVTVRSVPYGADATATVTVSSTKVPPTMGTPTISAVGAFVAGQRRLSVPYTAVTGSGPAYQIYWYPGENYLGNAKPPVTASIDGSGTISPILDESGPNGIGRYAVWIRSSAATNTTGTTAPSTTLSDWSDLKYVYISGTRTLSYNKNTTDTVGSLPSSTSGTDPWDGWVTTVSSNTPTRTGYTFNGWNTASDGTGTNYAASASITLTSDVTLWAKWTALTYSVTYNGNSNTGGSVPTDSSTYSNGATVTVKSNSGSLTRTNFVFSGWNTASDGSGTAYAATGSATFTMGTANVTLYARWLPLYLVSFDLNGGGGTAPTALRQSTSGGSITLPTQGSMTAPSGKPNFSGWVTSTTGTSALTGSYTPTADVTLYAYWTADLPTTTATGVRGYNNFGVTITLPSGTGSVVLEYGTTTSYGTSIGTFTTAGTKSPVGPLLANTLYYFRATPWSGTSGNGTQGTAVTGSVRTYTNPAHTAATPVNPTFQRFTSGVNSYIRYGWNNQSALTPTGDYAEWGYEFRVYSNSNLTTQLTGSPFSQAYNTIADSRLINGLSRIYVFSGEGSGTPYVGDFTYTTNPVYGRYRPYYIAHGSTTKVYGNWSNAI